MAVVVLIGPISAGKSTVGACLAERLSVPYVAMDELRGDYYREIGYDEELARRQYDEGGWWALYRYWKPFEAYAVGRILADHTTGVLDFGAGHSVYEDERLFQRVAEMLAPYPYVVLLLPSPDLEESLRILSSRDETAAQLTEANRHFLQHHSNYDLAKFIVYTGERPAAAICDEVLGLLDADAFRPPAAS